MQIGLIICDGTDIYNGSVVLMILLEASCTDPST